MGNTEFKTKAELDADYDACVKRDEQEFNAIKERLENQDAQGFVDEVLGGNASDVQVYLDYILIERMKDENELTWHRRGQPPCDGCGQVMMPKEARERTELCADCLALEYDEIGRNVLGKG